MYSRLAIIFLLIASIGHSRNVTVASESSASKAQLQSVELVVSKWIEEHGGNKYPNWTLQKKGPAQEELITLINKELSKQKLPLIKYSEKLSLVPAKLVAFAETTIVGVKISDGDHNYCLPCEVGQNSFAWSLTNQSPDSAPSKAGAKDTGSAQH